MKSVTFKMVSIGDLESQTIWEALHDLVPFAQFKKREKHPWMSVTFSLQLY